MSLRIIEVRSAKEEKEFVKLPFHLYKGNAFWVPPIIKGEIKALRPEENPMIGQCDTQFWIALKNGKCVGRIGAIIHHAHNKKTGKKAARFTRTEFTDDKKVVDLLFQTAEKWAKEKGMTEISGPLGFSNLDHQGMLVEGFDHLPCVASEYHLPYYKNHLDRLEYEKEMDWVEFRLDIMGEEELGKIQRISKIISKRYGLSIYTAKSSKELLTYGRDIFKVMNYAFEDLFSVVGLNEDVIDFYIDKYIKILDPSFVKILKDSENKVQGFTIAMPSLSEAMQKANGKIGPKALYYLYKASKKPETCDILLTGLHPDIQGTGASAMLFAALQEEMKSKGVKFLETTGMIETNQKAIASWQKFNHIQHKRKRCYTKQL